MMREAGATFAVIGHHFGVSVERARQLCRSPAEPPPFGLSVGTWNALQRAGLTTDDLRTASADELLRVPNLGYVGLMAIAEALDRPELRKTRGYCARVSHYLYTGEG